MLEFEIQNRFIEHVTGRRPITNPHANRLELYRELVYFRFQEVMANTFPIFTKKIAPERFEELVAGFIQHKPESPYIWQAPQEFIEFIKNRSPLPDLPWAEELLWYEWNEVDLLMRSPSPGAAKVFDWQKQWQLSPSTRIKRLEYRIYLNEFEPPGDYPLILYYNYDQKEVHFQEISPFLFDFFQSSPQSASDALAAVCAAHQLNPEEVKELLSETMQNYADKKILEAV